MALIWPERKKTSFPAVIPFEDCPAKTIAIAGKIVRGCSVPEHLRVCAGVVRVLRDIYRHTPKAAMIDVAPEALAAVHDIGKATPFFFQKIYQALGEASPFVLSLPQSVNHAEYSQLILEEYNRSLSRLAGAHHGGGFLKLRSTADRDPAIGGPEWRQAQREALEKIRLALSLPPWSEITIDPAMEAVVLGCGILADWIGSGMELGPERTATDAEIREAVYRAGFRPLGVREQLRFEDIFPFPPNALQRALGEGVRPGGSHVAEVAMGGGKTEAALFAAYRLLEHGQAAGIFFALPTQLTSEKIHQRMDDFLLKILPESEWRQSLLIHGNSWLDWELDSDREEDRENHDFSWFYGRKRALLAPFAVGTIDQALMAVINVRHNALRAFALAGKVVIIDELHSYDYYTGSLIAHLIRRLRDWRCTVIVLSATLTERAAAELLGLSASDGGSRAYPALAVLSPEGQQVLPLPADNRHSVDLSHTDSVAEAIQIALDKARHGEQVLWIENRVDDAQEIFRQLGQEKGNSIEIGLLHSRFPQCIRSEIETLWVGRWGKTGGKARAGCGRILVGTQICEQSLDIDCDFLVTALAPSDMLLQRIGRLWRHAGLKRPAGAECRVLLIHRRKYDPAADLTVRTGDDLPYERYVLVRTQQIWLERENLMLPDDIRPVLEVTYAERQEVGSMRRLKDDLERRKAELSRKALIAGASVFEPESDERAATRLSDVETVELLLIRKGNRGEPLSRRLYSPLADKPLSIPPRDAPAADRKKAIRELQRFLIRMDARYAPSYESLPLDELGHLLYVGEPGNRPLRGVYWDESDELLDGACMPFDSKYRWGFNSRLGLYRRSKK